MAEDLDLAQRIARLTPLVDVLAMIDAQVRPVAAHDTGIAAALGRTLGLDVTVAAALPTQATALRDGWALRSDLTTDAGPYAPSPLPQNPARVDAGEALPLGTDAVAPRDTVLLRNGLTQAIAPFAPGDGVIPAGADASAAKPLYRAGARLRASDIAALAICGIERVKICEPRVRIVHVSRTQATAALIAAAVQAQGGKVIARIDDDAMGLKDALGSDHAEAVIAVGGTGTGRADRSIETLARIGRVAVHGIGLMPGETSAIGFVDNRPVLLLPGRADAALSAWLTIGRRLLARLCGQTDDDAASPGFLARKVTSTIGIADVVLVRRAGERVEPLASGYWPLQAIADADGWIVVPAESEGYATDTVVSVRHLP